MKKHLHFSLLVILLFSGFSSHLYGEGAKKVNSITISNLDYVTLHELAKLYQLTERWDAKTEITSLERKGVRLSFRPGSAYAKFNTTTEKMPGAALIIHGRLAIPLSFALVKIEPFALPKKPKKIRKTNIVPKHRSFKLVLDPGHGGKDPGTIGRKGTKEKDIVLDICKRIVRQLKGAGVDVSLTRNNNTYLTLWRRTYISKKIGPDLFISIHANASKNKNIYGVESYYAKSVSANANGKYYKKNHKLSYYFANIVQRTLCQALVAKNRRVKKANFFVLKNATTPSVLIEVGFLSHHWEERKLLNASYRDKIAHAIVKSILHYKSKVGK